MKSRTRQNRGLLMTVMFLIVLAACNPIRARWVITQLTNNSYNDFGHQVSGSNVVWQGKPGSGFEIFLYDGSTITQLTNNGDLVYDPQVSGSKVVWQGREYHGDNEIFLAKNIPGIPCLPLLVVGNREALLYNKRGGEGQDYRHLRAGVDV